jgi:hypothetical protein
MFILGRAHLSHPAKHVLGSAVGGGWPLSQALHWVANKSSAEPGSPSAGTQTTEGGRPWPGLVRLARPAAATLTNRPLEAWVCRSTCFPRMHRLSRRKWYCVLCHVRIYSAMCATWRPCSFQFLLIQKVAAAQWPDSRLENAVFASREYIFVTGFFRENRYPTIKIIRPCKIGHIIYKCNIILHFKLFFFWKKSVSNYTSRFKFFLDNQKVFCIIIFHQLI